MRLLALQLPLQLALAGCAGNTRYICAGDSIPGTFTIKPGETISFPDHCAYDWQGGEVATAGGGKQLLIGAGR